MISNLVSRLDKLEQSVATIQQCSPCNASGATTQTNNTVITDGASLQQNTPNPFSRSTTIGYTLPEKFTTAQIMITDKNGKTLKLVNVSGSGKGNLNVDASVFASGAYHYSLFVDGKLIGTKQMVLAR
jgi:flagellar hook assembly protein FlgD